MKKVRKNKKKTAEAGKSRAKFFCPPQLADLLEAVSELSRHTRLGRADHLTKLDFPIFDTPDGGSRTYRVATACELTSRIGGLFAPLPSKLKLWLETQTRKKCTNFIRFEGCENFEHLKTLAFEYNQFVFLRESLLYVVEKLRWERIFENHPQNEDGTKTFRFEDSVAYEPHRLPPPFMIGERKGKIQMTGIGDFIIGIRSDALRFCEICDKLYFARRDLSKTCDNKACFDNLKSKIAYLKKKKSKISE